MLIVDHGYMHKLSQLNFLPGVVPALQMLKDAGYLLVCVTNQSGVARGMFPLSDVTAFNDYMLDQLASLNVPLDGLYVCPHHTDGKVAEYTKACDCRKPLPGLVKQAQRDFAIDMSKSFLIGDKDSDVECARNAGVKAVRITSGQYSEKAPADFTCTSLLDAAKWISFL